MIAASIQDTVKILNNNQIVTLDQVLVKVIEDY
jgi:hypothetical protein